MAQRSAWVRWRCECRCIRVGARFRESVRGRGVESVELEWNLAPTYPAPGLSPCHPALGGWTRRVVLVLLFRGGVSRDETTHEPHAAETDVWVLFSVV